MPDGKVQMNQPGYIYCFYIEGTNYYKIGVIRKQPHEYLKAERLKYFSSKQCSHTLVMLHSVPIDDIWEGEKFLFKFEQYHVGDCCFEFDSKTLNQVINVMEDCKNHAQRQKYNRNRRQLSLLNISLPPKIGTLITAAYYVCVLSGYQLRNQTYQDCLNANVDKLCKQSSDI
jgi:hypothetical protein